MGSGASKKKHDECIENIEKAKKDIEEAEKTIADEKAKTEAGVEEVKTLKQR